MRVSSGRCLLRQHLEKKRKSQRWLEEQTGITEQKISNYINGHAKMGYSTACTIAYVLGIHAEELYEQIIVDDRQEGN